MYISTPRSAIPQIVSMLRSSFYAGTTRPVEWRKQQLRSFWHMIDDNEEAIRAAVKSDIGKPLVQTQVLEIIAVKNDIIDMLEHLEEWLATKSVVVPAPFENWSPVIRRQPKGVCVAIGTWNYPVVLTLLPFIGIIACGNTGVLKPSEHAPATAILLAKLFPKYLDERCFVVVNGGAEVSEALLAEPLGHVIFTGGTEVGKLVMAAASKLLTPVTLELGGRNSAVVTGTADIAFAAKRIAWGKYAIAGQTCFAPNQVIVQEDAVLEFVESLKMVNQKFFEGKTEIDRVGRIINKTHWQRIKDLVQSSKGDVIFGGNDNGETLFIQPMAVMNIEEDDALVQSEIFGPILPILTYKTIEDSKRLLDKVSPTPLALYIFSEDKEEIEEFLGTLSAGSIAVNDIMGQVAPASLPFGGFGTSGFGRYRGKASIETFSHARSEVNVPTTKAFENLLDWRYPYNESAETVTAVKLSLQYPLLD